MSFEDFQGLVNSLRNPGDEGVPDTIYDDLTNVFNTTFEGYTANTAEKEAEIARLAGEVSRLKSANYDLLTKVSTGTDPIDIDGPDDADETPVTYDSLFKRK